LQVHGISGGQRKRLIVGLELVLFFVAVLHCGQRKRANINL
jgi:hypothetical protein